MGDGFFYPGEKLRTRRKEPKMSIEEIQSNEELQYLQYLQSIQTDEDQQTPKLVEPPPLQDNFKFTGMGSLLSSVRNLGEEDQQSVQDYMKTVFDSIRNGSFDATSLAENAPGALKQLADDQGIDLVSALKEMAQKFEEMVAKWPQQGPPPGPPPAPPESAEGSESSSTDSEAAEGVAS